MEKQEMCRRSERQDGMGSATAALGDAVQTPVGAGDGEEGVGESKCNAGLGVVPDHITVVWNKQE